ncbi:glycosyltransferase family 52 [Photobacterium leiognathi]|uniref:glycosyltransferase family 52 n=1 Tax=Photobacterium leiognathi TaxID=553611 RepID=UPI0029827539|nr:glycosyltransferase family 52 [Photobacterium leiognathi]
MNIENKNNILVVNSVYSLFYYMLMFDHDMNKTTLVFSGGINDEFTKKIPNKIVLKSGVLGILDVISKLIFDKKFRGVIFHKYKFNYFGHDHLFYSFLFSKNMSLIEDGLLNYSKSKRKFPLSIILRNKVPGYGSSIRNIYLSGIETVPVCIIDKVKIISIFDAWNKLSTEKKRFINEFFNVTLKSSNIEHLLLTQPFSEYDILTEKEKIDIYKKIYDNIRCEHPNSKIFIKPHPRELTDYQIIFPDAFILNSNCPSELLSLNSERIENVYTLYSTSIYTFNNSRKKMYGTVMSKKLSNMVGIIQEREI